MNSPLRSPLSLAVANELRLALRPSWLTGLLLAVRRRSERRAGERQVQLTLRSLRNLDARTLRDIGLDASELSSVSLEAAGFIEATRWRIWI
jgi:hypothetical protein